MKKIILIFIFLTFYTAPSIAQKIHFVDTSNQWFTTTYDSFFHTYGTAHYFFGVDTFIIDGNKFYDLRCFGVNGSSGYSFDLNVSEDTVAGIVYYLEGFGNVRILYKYNLHPGDTFHTINSYITFPVIDSVISVD